MKRLSEIRPQAGNIKYEMAAAYAMQDLKTEAFDALVRLQSTGYAFDIAADERLKNLHGTGVWDYLVPNFKANEVEFGQGHRPQGPPHDDAPVEFPVPPGRRAADSSAANLETIARP